ncbi:MAG: radical SAM protein [Selenomonadaceae bacterium]|nr:radical SAM protein [Selenomonadaceae bacterium]
MGAEVNMSDTNDVIGGTNILQSGIPEHKFATQYYVEILSECDLKCPLCPFSEREKYTRKKAVMDFELFQQIIDKIVEENPSATIGLYHNCEPTLHPELPKFIAYVKSKGLFCSISSNFNHVKNIKEILLAEIDEIIISVSGFYQETYGKSHVGGNVEVVKDNMRLLRRLMDETEKKPRVQLSYHVYVDNFGEEFDLMQDLCKKLKFEFVPTWARIICAEMGHQYFREREITRYNGETDKWFDELSNLGYAFYNQVKRMVYLPEDIMQNEWKNVRMQECIVNHRMCNITCEGYLELCNCGFDNRLNLRSFLEVGSTAVIDAKKSSLFCKECLTNNYCVYVHYPSKGNFRPVYKRLRAANWDDEYMRFLLGYEVDEIVDMAKKYGKVYVYGAGTLGQTAAKLLSDKGVNVVGFIVSDDKSGNQSVDVLPLSVVSEDTSSLIVVAVKRKFRGEIWENIRNVKTAVISIAEYCCGGMRIWEP